jgi:hypothetical protein
MNKNNIIDNISLDLIPVYLIIVLFIGVCGVLI